MNPIDARQIQWALKRLDRMASQAMLLAEDQMWLEAQRMVHRLDPSTRRHQQLISELRNIYNLKLITGRLTS